MQPVRLVRLVRFPGGKIMFTKDFVPPLILCQLIPNGYFQHVNFWWNCDAGMYMNPYVVDHRVSRHRCYPAPTLQEILEELCGKNPKEFYAMVMFMEGKWHVSFHATGFSLRKTDFLNPAEAALKLWFAINAPELL